jgi:hypothetical protein
MAVLIKDMENIITDFTAGDKNYWKTQMITTLYIYTRIM